MTQISAKVIAKTALARDVVALRIAPDDVKESLPSFEAGAHIDVRLPNGLTRSYSLTNVTDSATGAPAHYEIAVGRDANSRGGSEAIHAQLHVGSRLSIGAPRNHFHLNANHARVLLIAGGIGVTPIYAMAQSLAAQGRDFEVVLCARSAARMAYLEELRVICGTRLRTHADDEAGAPFDLRALLAQKRWDGVYACGPTAMLDHIGELTAGWSADSVVTERFTAPVVATNEPVASFHLSLQSSGLETVVSPDESVLDAIERLGVAHPFSCREGICGTCESQVLAGVVDHRCAVLSQSEKDSQMVMMPCVSRCSSERLVLDL